MNVGVIVVILLGSVLLWRGIWGLLDEYFIPNNVLVSYWLSLVAGLAILTYYNRLENQI